MAKKKKLARAQLDAIDGKIARASYFQGWMVDPRRITADAVSKLLMSQAVNAHLLWTHNIQQGRVPAEDISPSEGYILMAYFVRELGRRAKIKPMQARELIERYHRKFKRQIMSADIAFRRELNEVSPGYFEVPEDKNEEGK